MKLYPVFLLCLLTFVRSQFDFFALFDFSVAKMNGTDNGKYSLYTNLVNDTDTDNLIYANEINGDGVQPNSLWFHLSNNKSAKYASAIVVFDNAVPARRRRLTEIEPADTFKYKVDSVGNNLIVSFDLYGAYHEAFRTEIKTARTIIALAINFETVGNTTKSTVYYLDSDKLKSESTRTFNYSNPSLLLADYVKYDHNFGNLYYVGFSNGEVNGFFLEAWVKDHINFGHKKATCENCKENFGCPKNAILSPLPLGMRRYKCACKKDSALFEETAASIDCIKLAFQKDCALGCANACATIDPDMCYEKCTPGYNGTALGKNFFSCTPIPGDHNSIWFLLFVVTIPIFIAAYIAKVIFVYCYYKVPKTAPVQDEVNINLKGNPLTGHSSPTVTHIVTSGPGSPIIHGRLSSAVPESEIDTYKPSLVKAEDEKEFNLGSVSKQSESEEKSDKSVKSVKSEKSEKFDFKTCKMCERIREDLTAVFKCHHAAVCKECASIVRRCPICGDDTML